MALKWVTSIDLLSIADSVVAHRLLLVCGKEKLVDPVHIVAS